MNKVHITLVSDTHSKHAQVTNHLPGGELLLHSGDISNRGEIYEIESFLKWYKSLSKYDHRVFIAGNHDWGFQDYPGDVSNLLDKYCEVDYLQDGMYVLGDDYDSAIKIWGSPWQPRFNNWAFNADRGEDIKQYWDKIPNGIDILITHGPAFGHLDTVIGQTNNLGCEDLNEAIQRIKPKIHVCGHIHSGHGYKFDGTTHYFNASVLNERYEYAHKPFVFDWDPETNEVTFIDNFGIDTQQDI